MILVDHQIRRLSNACESEKSLAINPPLIEPYSFPTGGNKVISYGESSCGYDLRMGFKVLQYNKNCDEIIDPKRMDDEEYQKRIFVTHHLKQGEQFVLRPSDYILATSLEYIRMPSYLCGICLGKSTYARSLIMTNLTPLEPGWEGRLTIEIGNVSQLRACLYAGEGLAQIVFHKLADYPENDYAKKKGKYQNQQDVQPPIVR